MVAVAGAGWRLASSLDALIDETDRLYPNRDHTSDGSIGDAAHAARDSDHNPADGWVCAVDIDEDLSSQIHTLERLAEHLIDDRDHRVKYLIYEGRICKAYVDSAGHPAWRWYPYTGLNDHSHHLHVSIWNTSAARDDRGPWWPQTEAPKPPTTSEEDDDMAAQIVWYTDPKDSSKAHAYQVFGSGIGKHLTPSALKLARGLGVKEVNAGKPFGADWRETVALLDGPCKSV